MRKRLWLLGIYFRISALISPFAARSGHWHAETT
jgi:hypothetical protein